MNRCLGITKQTILFLRNSDWLKLLSKVPNEVIWKRRGWLGEREEGKGRKVKGLRKEIQRKPDQMVKAMHLRARARTRKSRLMNWNVNLHYNLFISGYILYSLAALLWTEERGSSPPPTQKISAWFSNVLKILCCTSTSVPPLDIATPPRTKKNNKKIRRWHCSLLYSYEYI